MAINLLLNFYCKHLPVFFSQLRSNSCNILDTNTHPFSMKAYIFLKKKMGVIGKSLSNQVYDNSVPFPTIIKVQFLLAFYLFNLYTEYNFCAIAIISILANTFISLETRIFFANPLCMVYNLEPIRRSCEERGIEDKMIVKYCIKCKVFLYLCVCVCACVCERETQRQNGYSYFAE
jgi:hypothetical protein